MKIVKSSSYVVDHSNSLSSRAKTDRERNYYPSAVHESRNYDRDRKEELLEELVDLLSESIHHRYEEKVILESSHWKKKILTPLIGFQAVAKVEEAQQLDVENFDIGPSDVGLQSLGEDNPVPLPGSKFQLLDSEGLSLDERLTVDEARELQRNLEKLMEEGGDLDAVALSNGKLIRIPPHVVMSTLHPNDLSVERRIHEAYKDQRFVGRDFQTEAPYSAKAGNSKKATADPRARVPQRTTPEPQPTTKRAFVVRKRKKAEALAARARQMAKHKDCFMSQNWKRKSAALNETTFIETS